MSFAGATSIMDVKTISVDPPADYDRSDIVRLRIHRADGSYISLNLHAQYGDDLVYPLADAFAGVVRDLLHRKLQEAKLEADKGGDNGSDL